MCADTTQTPDYKDTLNLPKTDFPMRAGLPKARTRMAGTLGKDRRL